ncbi:c-type cytochrome [Noviherbaspirillum sp.]|uniref:c-type cytochrome n=1 Tax=Noviherbaspirillum sp. TaxID=1926288 RepID=UPI002D50BDD4|nr:c-type cytochrome [Noviherbaspirillum sp.]HZW22360.1 c-type cytochrome [Noviherbaspirillum sp.]
MKRSISIALIFGSLFSTAALADANLAKAKNCMACHSVDKKVVGPAFKEIAAKYGSQKGAEDQLVQKVLKGSSGVWGGMPMPPNAVSEKEAHTLVQWILKQK